MLLAGDHFRAFAFDTKALADVRKIKIIVKFNAGSDAALLQALMGFLNCVLLRGQGSVKVSIWVDHSSLPSGSVSVSNET
jgi:hypothetical protein